MKAEILVPKPSAAKPKSEAQGAWEKKFRL
jgi:hypothetical protein